MFFAASAMRRGARRLQRGPWPQP